MSVSYHSLAPFVRGAVSLQEESDGLVVARRFFAEQLEHLSAVGRRERAIATAGVVIDFATDGTEVSFDCRVVRKLDPSHPVYRAVMLGGATGTPPYGLAEEGNVDGIDIVVAGRLVATVPASTGTIRLAFENPEHEELEVRIYLPNIMSVAFGNLRTNGSLKPLPHRGYLLALGDSITQGFVCGRPSLSYPAQVASTLGIDLLNQAVAGHVFDEDTLGGFSLWREEPPEVVIVAYGTNDWARLRSPGSIEGGAVAFLERLSRLFPGVPTYVLSPLWRVDEFDPVPCERPLTWIHQLLGRVCSRHENMHVVDGYHGIPKSPDLFADGTLHPGSECMGLVADLLLEAMCNDSVDLVVSRRVARRLDAAAGVEAPEELVTREARIDRATSLRNGSPETHPEFDRLVRTIWRLRQPDGCPWDKEQTHASLAKHMVEEAYEAAEAMRRGEEEPEHLREELGDVLEQVLLNSQVADDADEFDIDDVCRELNEKLIRRHPHVFGDVREGAPAAGAAGGGAAGGGAGGRRADGATGAAGGAADGAGVAGVADGATSAGAGVVGAAGGAEAAGGAGVPTSGGAGTGEGVAGGGAATGGGSSAGAAGGGAAALTAEAVLDIWDEVKREERERASARKGLLDSVPVALPALMQAQKISKRAAKAGFEWETVADVWDKVAEERAEFEREPQGSAAAAEEFGDMLFALVNVARRCGIDAEEALATSNAKFRRRWAQMEARANVEELSTEQLNELWDAVKEGE